jgi:hypothetical protein
MKRVGSVLLRGVVGALLLLALAGSDASAQSRVVHGSPGSRLHVDVIPEDPGLQ